MTEYPRTVLKNPANPDATIADVLEMIIFQTKDGDELIRYDIQPDKVVLTFDGV